MLLRTLNPYHVLALQIPISPPPLRLGYRLKRLAGFDLAGELLDQLTPIGADLAPIAHQHDAAEQIPLDHEAVEPRHALLLVAPMQHKVVLDRGSDLVRHRPALVS